MDRFGVVLAVDDMPLNLRVLKIFLEKHFEIITVKSGFEGFAVLSQRPDVSIILLDIEMPQMSGFEFLQKLRNMPTEQKKLPVICVTGLDATPEFIRECIKKGATDYVSKPVEPEIIEAKICKLLNLNPLLMA